MMFVDLHGPEVPINSLEPSILKRLMTLYKMRAAFDSRNAIDVASRAEVVEVIKGERTGVYDKEDDIVLARGTKLLNVFDDPSPKTKIKKAKSPSPTVVNTLALTEGGTYYGRSTVIVRTTKENACAFFWDEEARCRFSEHDTMRKVLSTRNSHHQVTFHREKSVVERIGGRDKVSVSRAVYKEIDEDEIIMASVPTEHDLTSVGVLSERRTSTFVDQLMFRGKTDWKNEWKKNIRIDTIRGATQKALDKTVRKRVATAVQIIQFAPLACRVVFVTEMEMDLKYSLMRHRMLISSLMISTRLTHHFQGVRRLETLDEDDGIEIGEMFMVQTSEEKHRETKFETLGDVRARVVLREHDGLQQLEDDGLVFFRPMMSKVIENRLTVPSPVSAQLCNTTEKDGGTMGSCLAIKLASNLTPEAAVDEWIMNYPSLKEFDAMESFFRPMMEVVARQLLGSVAWGLKMRVFAGSGLSVIDMTSDVVIITRYLSQSNDEDGNDLTTYGYALLAMVISSILLQLIIVIMQHGGKTQHLLRDVLFVVSGLKPGVDAYRVASGAEMEDHHMFDAKEEYVIMKCIEVFSVRPNESKAFLLTYLCSCF
jgi:hypothetical protein